MPTEYRQIPKAPLYEISKDGDIQRISNQSMILPYPLKSNNVKLLVDGERKSFLIDKLIKEVWENVVTKVAIEDAKETKNEISVPKSTTLESPYVGHGLAAVIPESEPHVIVASKPSDSGINNIMKLNCKMSIKIWKLYMAGLKEPEIKKIVKHPYSVSVAATIERYKKNSKLAERANVIK